MKRRGRVLCISSNFPRYPGDSTTPFVLDLCKDLQQLGWRIDVLAPHARGALREEVLEGVAVERFRYAFPESAQTVCYQGGALINLRKRPRERLKLPLLVAAERPAAQSRLAREDYDLVHSHWILPQGLVGAVASRLASLPHVVTVHGGDLFGLRSPAMLAAKRMALMGADAVTVNSSLTEKGVRELVPPDRNVVRIPMGVSVAPAQEDELREASHFRERFARGRALVGFVGRLVEEKGVGDLLVATRWLRDRGIEVNLVVAGEGQDRARFEGMSSRLSLQDQVTFLGWAHPAMVRVVLLACDVLAAPSKPAPDGWIEAQGLSILEAMALGVPVVASRSGGIVDSVQDGVTGFLVDVADPEALGAGIARALDSADLKRSIGIAARAHVQANFSRTGTALQFDRLFSSLVH